MYFAESFRKPIIRMRILGGVRPTYKLDSCRSLSI
jgi:hypothetical protein